MPYCHLVKTKKYLLLLELHHIILGGWKGLVYAPDAPEGENIFEYTDGEERKYDLLRPIGAYLPLSDDAEKLDRVLLPPLARKIDQVIFSESDMIKMFELGMGMDGDFYNDRDINSAFDTIFASNKDINRREQIKKIAIPSVIFVKPGEGWLPYNKDNIYLDTGYIIDNSTIIINSNGERQLTGEYLDFSNY